MSKREVDEQVNGDDSIDLRDLLGLLIDEWRWIAGITLGVLLIAVLYAFTATPVYQTNALVQVEKQDSGLGGIEELSSMLSGELPSEAEIEIVRSRMVLNDAIAQEKLAISVEPKRFPLFGEAIARRYDGETPADPWLGFDSYAWGGERIQVDRVDVEGALVGEVLTLVAGEGGAYTLYGPEHETLLTGKVGEAAEGGGVGLFIAELVARAGTVFQLVRHHPLATLADLRDRFSVAELGKQTGILRLALEGTDREAIASTLNTIANIYLRQNVERQSKEAEQSLEFLNEQLPELKTQLEDAEHALNRFRVEEGSVDLNLEAQGLLEQLTEVEGQMSQLELQKAELAQRFTAEHPTMQAIEQQRRELEQVRAKLDRQIRELPENEQDSLRLMRDVNVANQLYLLLLNRAQELKVVRAGTVGNVRIIDQAYVPREPVKPKKPLVLALGLTLGALLGVFAVFLRQALDSGIRDPKVLEQHFGLPVYAIVPRSQTEAQNRPESKSQTLIALRDPQDAAVESLRSLRTSLEFLFHESPNRILAIGGPAPEIGKSFVAANLGTLMAQVGRRVLVVDADLRRGHLHRKFGLERAPGLSELIAGAIGPDEAIRKTDAVESLAVLPSGRLPPNPAELLVSRRFEDLLQELAERFDVVLLDAPPILAASEAANIAKLAGINLVVVRSGQQNRREVELAVDRLVQAGAPPKGFVFNDMTVGSRRYEYAGYRYYKYGPEQAT